MIEPSVKNETGHYDFKVQLHYTFSLVLKSLVISFMMYAVVSPALMFPPQIHAVQWLQAWFSTTCIRVASCLNSPPL